MRHFSPAGSSIQYLRSAFLGQVGIFRDGARTPRFSIALALIGSTGAPRKVVNANEMRWRVEVVKDAVISCAPPPAKIRIGQVDMASAGI